MLEAAAIGVPDDLKGESLWVYVVLRAGRRRADDALREALRARVAEHLGPSFRPGGRSLHRRAAEDAEREGVAPRDPRGRDGDTARRPVRARGSRGARCDRSGPLRWSSSSGARVVLRPLRSDDWDAWREVRQRAPGLARAVGAEARARERRTRRRSARRFASRCGAWERQRQFDAAYGFGLFLTDGTFAGEVSLGSVQRGPFQMAYIGYWIDEALAGRGYVPEAVVLLMRYAFETLAAAPPRGRDRAPQHRRAGGSRRSSGLRDEGIALGFLQIQGVFEDHVRYAMTVEEWHDRGPELVARYLAPDSLITS